ncbi:alpha/beta hydrolase-fold protein [Streptomyces sp. T-3]|nr:alpha/beta hydrolase-fold protein [Streptomyces sp. T-3]
MTHSFPGNDRRRPQGRRRRPHTRRRLLVVAASIVALGLVAWPVLNHFDVFSDNGDPMSFGQPQAGTGNGGVQTAGNGKTLMPTGPAADVRVAATVQDGTKIGEVTFTGKKSGFTGKVWLWAPKEYSDPKYAKSGFPVLIALPGGAGYPTNYWMGTDLKLEESIDQWADQGKSLPFIVAMPVLNPENHDKDPKDPKLGTYWDGSDIPGQPKMGTWLAEDVPDLVKQNFRTINSRDGWAFMGSSTGAFAGLKTVLQHPDKFKAVIASGPDVVPDSRLWAGHQKEQDANNPMKLAKQLIADKGPDVYIAFQAGTGAGDAGGLAHAKQFMAAYGNKGPVHAMLNTIPGGEHSARDYVPNMPPAISWISKQMQGPTPSQ